MAEFVLDWAGSGTEQLLTRIRTTPARLHEGTQRALDRIDGVLLDAANLGSGGVLHIRTGALNDSLNGIGPNAVHERAPNRVVRGTTVRYARIQQHRFGDLFPVDPSEPTRIVGEEMHRAIQED